MDGPPATPQICVLKMNVKCEKCQKNVKKQLQKIHGVHSFDIDANEGKVTISSSVNPHVLVEMLAKSGKKAELLWEQKPPNNQSHAGPERRFKTLQFVADNGQGCGFELNQRAQVAQLQELAKNRRLQQLELIHSRNIKMTFKDHDESFNHSDDRTPKIIMNDVHDGINHKHNLPLANGGGPAPAQCGGDGAHQGMNNAHDCYHDVDYVCGAATPGPGNRWMEEATSPFGSYYSPYGPLPPQSNYGYYVAPQSNYYPARGPPASNDVHCGDESKACSIM